MIGKRGLAMLAAASALAAVIATTTASAQDARRVRVSGEIVDSFCAVSAIMFAYGTAHYQCAVWCAVGGVPVSIKGDDGEFYMVLKLEDDDQAVINPKLVKIQANHVTVDGDLLERDGVKYLLVTKVADDKGIINLTHDEHGVVPFGN